MAIENIMADDDSNEPMKHQVVKLVISTVGAFVFKQMIEVYYDHIRTTKRKKEQE